MKFEKLNYSNGNKKRIFIYGFMLCAALVIIINLFLTRAKYVLTESIPIANGTINYTLVDFELAGIKFKANDSEDYADVNTIEDNYVFNENESYCTEKYTNEGNSFEDVRNSTIKLVYDSKTKTISVNPYSKKGTKCYLYFDKELTSEDVLANLGITETKGKVESFTGPSCDNNSNCGAKNMNQNGIYEAEDDFGASYYYRGTVDDNWLKFGKATSETETGDIWWRIIRINGNGTIRIMYAGTYASGSTPNTKGEKNLIYPTKSTGRSDYPRAVYFNQTYKDNKYVGYMYNDNPQVSTKFEEAHNVTSDSEKSTILTQVELWWQQTNLGTLMDTIDVNTGFCSDTQVNNTEETWRSGDTKNGYGTQYTAYGAYGRILLNGTWRIEDYPTLKCGVNPSTKKIDSTAQKRDLYTYTGAQPVKTTSSTVEGNKALPIPVGLITADEAVFAGAFGNQSNNGYWLNIDQYYWTMSPSDYFGSASMFFVQKGGFIGYGEVHNNVSGARPVINLKAGTTFTFDKDKPAGTTTNPYVVEISN